MDEEKLRELKSAGLSQRQMAAIFGCSQKKVRNRLVLFGISTDRAPKEMPSCALCGIKLNSRRAKFCSQRCVSLATVNSRMTDDGFSSGFSATTMRKWLKTTRGYGCQSCGNVYWMGKPIPLEMHHVDGNAHNNSLDNLRLLCANCHGLTDTFKGRNRGNGVRPR